MKQSSNLKSVSGEIQSSHTSQAESCKDVHQQHKSNKTGMGLDSASNNCFFYRFPPFYLHFKSYTQMPILQTLPTTHSVSLKEASRTCTLITKT